MENLNEPRAMREMTPDEIRHQELGELLGYIEGNPIDGSPEVSVIMAAIRHRMDALIPPPTAEQPAEEPSAAIKSIFEGLRRGEIETDRRVAIEFGIDLLKWDLEHTPAERLIEPEWAKTLATSIAVNLVGIISAQ